MVQELMLLQKGKRSFQFNNAKEGRLHNWVKNYIP